LSRPDEPINPKTGQVYFERYLHRPLRQKAAETDKSISELVNAAITEAFAEDAEDLAASDCRRNEPDLRFEEGRLKVGLSGLDGIDPNSRVEYCSKQCIRSQIRMGLGGGNASDNHNNSVVCCWGNSS
jgi:hypothetical protein